MKRNLIITEIREIPAKDILQSAQKLLVIILTIKLNKSPSLVIE